MSRIWIKYHTSGIEISISDVNASHSDISNTAYTLMFNLVNSTFEIQKAALDILKSSKEQSKDQSTKEKCNVVGMHG